MLSSQNTGKYLTARYWRNKEKCAQDKSRFTPEEQAYYEISGQSEGMGDRDRIEKTFHIDTQPIDPETQVRKDGYDLRDRPEAGGHG